ncbi:MAG: FG-GAP-like repeat-containing protein [Planctomycetota bacterium]|jgi:hypothetical protein
MFSHKYRGIHCLPFIIVLIGLFGPLAFADIPKFEYHQIAKIGNKMGQTSLVDVDKDGDLDWITGCNNGQIWWFEYKAPDNWLRHTLAPKAPTDVGGTAFDIDGDGWPDQVSGQSWFRNTGKPREEEFIEYPNAVTARCHDNVAADIDGDGKLDVVAMSDRSALYWYKIPADPTKHWIEHKIDKAVHGAIDPAGVADIDGDGDNDVVRTNIWFENADGKGTKWIAHENIDFGQPKARYPLMTKTWISDIDKDGDNDIVQAEGDCISGRVAWHENRGGEGRIWIKHIIADKAGQDYHSLALADFDNDGDLDIFSGGGPLTQKPPHKWFIWENLDGRGEKFEQHEILSGKRCHEAKAADVDRDGDIDICSKPWNGNEHVYLRNMLMEHRISPTASGPKPLLNAHAHNDYAHDRPLFDALDHGFTSVEADIHLVDGDLLVAHDPDQVKPDRTLRSLYLEPLKKRIAQNSGRVYPNGPQFTLFIDIKTQSVATYKVLSKMLVEYRNIITSFSSGVRDNKAIVVYVSGNRPRALMESEPLRYAGYDGRLTDLQSDAPAALIPIISDRWSNHFSYKGSGPMPPDQQQKLKTIIQTAHKKGRIVRFWATPDKPSPQRQNLWRILLENGVDLLNTDDLPGLQQFLLERTIK